MSGLLVRSADWSDCLNRLPHRKDSCNYLRLLFGRAARRDPLSDEPLLLLVKRQLVGPAPKILLATHAQVRAKMTVRFERYVSRRCVVLASNSTRPRSVAR